MKQKDIITLIVPAFILIVAWVIFNVYHNSVTSTIPETLNIQIIPINPSFNDKTIQSLKQREKIAPIYELQSPTVIPTPTPNPATSSSVLTPTPTITPTLSVSPTSTQGGQTQ